MTAVVQHAQSAGVQKKKDIGGHSVRLVAEGVSRVLKEGR
jgi:hypothetical protein